MTGDRRRHERMPLVMLLVLASMCAARAQLPLRVAAAADLQPVLPQMVRDYEAKKHVHVDASFGASGTLAAQIQNGAPFDLFLAADLGYPQRLIDAGLATASMPEVYAQGTLVLWARKSRFPKLTLDALRDPSVAKVAIANPEHAPYGRAAKAALEKMGLSDAMAGKLAIAENIAQAAQFAESGNADLGLISLNSAESPQLKNEGSYLVVPAQDYPPIEQGGVVLKRSTNQSAAQAFLDFVRSTMLKPGDSK